MAVGIDSPAVTLFGHQGIVVAHHTPAEYLVFLCTLFSHLHSNLCVVLHLGLLQETGMQRALEAFFHAPVPCAIRKGRMCAGTGCSEQGAHKAA